jgi:hypothetical protein
MASIPLFNTLQEFAEKIEKTHDSVLFGQFRSTDFPGPIANESALHFLDSLFSSQDNDNKSRQ